jgi:hypothetical protein
LVEGIGFELRVEIKKYYFERDISDNIETIEEHENQHRHISTCSKSIEHH